MFMISLTRTLGILRCRWLLCHSLVLLDRLWETSVNPYNHCKGFKNQPCSAYHFYEEHQASNHVDDSGDMGAKGPSPEDWNSPYFIFRHACYTSIIECYNAEANDKVHLLKACGGLYRNVRSMADGLMGEKGRASSFPRRALMC